MKEEVKNHLENYFKKLEHCRAVPKGLAFTSLSEADKEWLDRPFSEEEIKLAVWDCDSSKSPGPYGFTIEFSQFFVDVVNFLKDFNDKARLTKGCTSSLISFIPKAKNPVSISEYKPICFVGSMYNIVAKTLVERLRSIIGKLVSSNQTAFIPVRNISNGVLVVN